jgi:hypothetical protein
MTIFLAVDLCAIFGPESSSVLERTSLFTAVLVSPVFPLV